MLRYTLESSVCLYFTHRLSHILIPTGTADFLQSELSLGDTCQSYDLGQNEMYSAYTAVFILGKIYKGKSALSQHLYNLDYVQNISIY